MVHPANMSVASRFGLLALLSLISGYWLLPDILSLKSPHSQADATLRYPNVSVETHQFLSYG